MTDQHTDDAPEAGESDEEYPLAPAERDPSDREPVWFPVDSDDLSGAKPPPERFQFSLGELLLLVLGASLFLSILGYFPEEYAIQNFAGLAGLGALVSMLVLALTRPTWPIIHLAWWVMFGLYVLACIAALIKG